MTANVAAGALKSPCLEASEVSRQQDEIKKALGLTPRGRVRRWLPWVALGLAVAGAAGAWSVSRQRSEEAARPRFITAPVTRGELEVLVAATGTLTALDTVEVGAEITGRITEVRADYNSVVKKDDVLAVIYTEQLDAQVEEGRARVTNANASVRTAKATAAEAAKKLTRARQLAEKGLLSPQDLEAAEAADDRARAGVASAQSSAVVARASLKSLETNRARAVVRSPIDGIVLARRVEAGQTVTAGFQTPVLFTIARDLTQMQLSVDVDEADVGRVREGQAATFTVDAYPRRSFAAKVTSVRNLPKASSSIVTYEAVLSLSNEERLLRPGMTATASIVTDSRSGVLLVPNAALRFKPPAAAGSGRSSSGGGLPIPGLGGPRGPWGGGSRPRAASSAEGGGRGAAAKDAVYQLLDGAPRRVEVELGPTDGKFTELVAGGLEAGAEVIVQARTGAR